MLTEPNIQPASNQKLICPICQRDVKNHTELESVTCVNVGKITTTQNNIRVLITESKGCDRCLEQERALKQLWSLIQDRAHPTNFTWRCTNCNQERQLSINWLSHGYGITALQPYLWICSNCGWKTEKSVDACPKCQNRVWGRVVRIEKLGSVKPAKPHANERLESPQIEKNVKNYVRQLRSLFNSVECGTCHAIIYRPATKFDRQAFEISLRTHYAESSKCNPRSQTD